MGTLFLLCLSLCVCVQALNQLFEKIIALDIDERHLLRLGHGEEALETNKDFSRWVVVHADTGIAHLTVTYYSSYSLLLAVGYRGCRLFFKGPP